MAIEVMWDRLCSRNGAGIQFSVPLFSLRHEWGSTYFEIVVVKKKEYHITNH
jgi:hypothetical protein